MLATFVSILVVIAILAILLANVGITGLFMNARPTGDRAMGLIVPFAMLAGAALLLTFAALLGAFRTPHAAAGAIAASPVLSGFLVVAITLGTALAAGAAFMLWCEPNSGGKDVKMAVVPIGILVGVVGPVLLAVMLFVGVWMPKSSAVHALANSTGIGLGLKVGFFALCTLALAGYSAVGFMFHKEVQRVATNHAAAIARAAKERAEMLVFENMSPKERLVEDLSNLSETAPLWTIVMYLPDQPGMKSLDDECRGLVVNRALEVSNFDAELVDCMKSREYLYRQGAAEFLIAVPDEQFNAHIDAWGEALIMGLKKTADGIDCRPAWLSETWDSNPDPLGHVQSLLTAAERFKSWRDYPKMQSVLREMANYAGMLNTDKKRGKLLKMLEKAGYRAAEVRP